MRPNLVFLYKFNFLGGYASKAQGKNGLRPNPTIPISPFSRDAEVKAEKRTIVPTPAFQDENDDLLRKKQQHEFDEFLEVTFSK